MIFFRPFNIKQCWSFSKDFSAFVETIMWFCAWFCLYTIYICWFMFVEQSLHPWMNHTWSWCMIFLMCCWIQFAVFYWELLCLWFIKEIGIWSSFCCILVWCNAGFIEWVWQSSVSVTWKSLRSIGTSSSLKFSLNSAMNQAGPGIFFIGRLKLP
jgi:hypothetical protein